MKNINKEEEKTDVQIKEKYSEKNMKKHTFDSLTPRLKSTKIIRTKEKKLTFDSPFDPIYKMIKTHNKKLPFHQESHSPYLKSQ